MLYKNNLLILLILSMFTFFEKVDAQLTKNVNIKYKLQPLILLILDSLYTDLPSDYSTILYNQTLILYFFTHQKGDM